MEGLMLQLLWYHLASLRLMLCISPQYGYVFPDEFFQSSEIMAGDILGLSHHRSWEWNPVSPTRTIIFPAISSGLPFLLLKFVSSYFGYRITPHNLLLFPRIWMTIQSLAIDILIHKLAFKLFRNKNIANAASLVFASSYTSWIYCTRTFSNCTETLLFGLLLHLVTAEYDRDVVKPGTNTSDINSENRTPVHITDINEDGKSKTNSFLISAVIVCGFFIRISFVGYAIAPLTYWLCKGLSNSSFLNALKKCFQRTLLLLPGTFFSCLFIITCDCAYFNSDKLLEFPLILEEGNITRLLDWFKTLPLTPLNSLVYNLDINNLANHGLHPWFLHLTVNLPLMFSPLIFILVLALVTNSNNYLGNHAHGGMSRKELMFLYIMALGAGLIALSCFSHQEPRFLLPLAVPVSVLLSRCVYPFSAHKLLISVWVAFNVICYSFYGIFHQGGIVPTLDFVSTLARVHDEQNLSRDIDVLFYKTYMPPIQLVTRSQKQESENVHLQIVDVAGNSQEDLEGALNKSLFSSNKDVYLVIPATLPCGQYRRLRHIYGLEELFSVFPHLSMEDPPWAKSVCYTSGSRSNFFLNFTEHMTLIIYKVKWLRDVEQNKVTQAVYFTSSKLHTSVL